MRYSAEPKYRKYVKGYSFLSLAKNFGDKYAKILINTAAKTGIDAAKTASKRVVQTAEATGNLTRYKTKQNVKKKMTKDKKFTYLQKNGRKFLMT